MRSAKRTEADGAEKREKVTLEKGDLPALLIAAFFNFILPIMLVCGAICLITYLFFTRTLR